MRDERRVEESLKRAAVQSLQSTTLVGVAVSRFQASDAERLPLVLGGLTGAGLKAKMPSASLVLAGFSSFCRLTSLRGNTLKALSVHVLRRSSFPRNGCLIC